jgi:hypothetical protein
VAFLVRTQPGPHDRSRTIDEECVLRLTATRNAPARSIPGRPQSPRT